MTLTEAKAALAEKNTPENQAAFVEAFAALVNTNQEVYVPIQREAGRIRQMFAGHRGEIYAAMYSSYDVAVDANQTWGRLEITKLIDLIFATPRIAGILVDPGKDEVPVTRRAIHENTVCKDPRLEKRDWGTGIPKYEKSDLMVIEELMDAAMDIAADAAMENGFELVDSCSSPAYLPNYILKKDGELYYVVVEAAIAPGLPQLSEQKKKSILENADQVGAHCLYAPVALGSRDEARFKAGLALTGDEYMVSFAGFLPLL